MLRFFYAVKDSEQVPYDAVSFSNMTSYYERFLGIPQDPYGWLKILFNNSVRISMGPMGFSQNSLLLLFIMINIIVWERCFRILKNFLGFFSYF